MRTTLDLSDEILAAARAAAATNRRSIGSIISEWARAGLRGAGRKTRDRRGFPVFDVPRGGPPITPELVARLINDEGIPPRR